MSSEPKVDGATLTGVSETALLTLKVRASEARRPDAIDFDFAKFGYSRRQDMALRALAFDDAT
ncbi:O-methyltransferase involved in polyketide biosynthesis [Mycobacterium sp. AZCC_0083]|nr:O-methyltransferase involved in polyketide biosynthesis [Mycobacterium sp. AZCC_0083]